MRFFTVIKNTIVILFDGHSDAELTLEIAKTT